MVGFLKRLISVPVILVFFATVPVWLVLVVPIWIIGGPDVSEKSTEWYMTFPDILWDWAVE